MQPKTLESQSEFSFQNFLPLARYTPLAMVTGFAGYYSLGFAYKTRLMATIDHIAIEILCHFVGYAGLGAWMPVYQWYAAWGVRVVIGAGCGMLYILFERIVIAFYRKNFDNRQEKPNR